MARQLTHRNLVGSLLQLENLLINKLTFFMMDHIRVQGTLFTRLFAGFLFSTTASGKSQSGETTFNMNIFAVPTVLALNMNGGRFGRDSGSSDHDTRDTDKVRNICCVQITDRDV